MSPPEFPDPLDDGVALSEGDGTSLLARYHSACIKAAYWQGVAETQAIQIEALTKDRGLMIGYLKDRLDRFEVKAPN